MQISSDTRTVAGKVSTSLLIYNFLEESEGVELKVGGSDEVKGESNSSESLPPPL